MLTVKCGSCGEGFLVSDEVVGTQITCPACAKPITVEAPVDDYVEGPVSEGAWEYMTLTDLGRMGHVDEKKLNRLGRAGWELVSIFRESPESHTTFYFKRPLRP